MPFGMLGRDLTGRESEGSLKRRISAALPQLTPEQVVSLGEAIDRVIRALRPQRIYVFGSHSRGSATADSDVDLLVIVDQSDLPGHRRDQAAYEAVGPHLVPLDLIVMTREEFEQLLPVVSSLPVTVEREGRLLYVA